ncbi:MAG: hypothetical protein NTY77_20565 [Elusimicrobia bacterium]|nr:hypothetical protein [Elusimicrobiota bacterium]
MKKASIGLLGGALVLLGWLAAGWAQEGPGGGMLYLRTPEERLARLDGVLHMSLAQRAAALRVLRRVDATVRAAVKGGDDKIRALLDQERQVQFDEVKSDTEVAPASMGGRGNFRPLQQQMQGQGGGQGGQGGGMQGGQGMGGMSGQGGGQQGGPGGQQGRRMGPGGRR